MKRKCKKIVLAALVALTTVSTTVIGAPENTKSPTKVTLDLLPKVKKSLVKVQYYLQMHKDQAPEGVQYWCGNCNSFHHQSAEKEIANNTPMEIPGYMLSSGKIISSDMKIHPRFIKEIKVKSSDGNLSGAEISAYHVNQQSVELTLKKPLAGAKALPFTTEPKSPLFTVAFSNDLGFWNCSINPFALKGLIHRYENGSKYYMCTGNAMVIDQNGQTVAFTTYPRVNVDNSWKKSPEKWTALTKQEMKDKLADIQTIADQGIFLTRLNLRSPKKKQGRGRFSYRGDDNSSKTKIFTRSILLKDNTVVVLANLGKKVTARLENITLITKDGKELKASFVASLKVFGAFIAKLDETPTSYKLSLAEKSTPVETLLPELRSSVIGEELENIYHHQRVDGFEIGWQKQRYPRINPAENTFLFDLTGKLLTFPLTKRELQEDQFSRSYDYFQMQAIYLSDILANLDQHIDKNNCPKGAEVNQVAFFGVECQALNSELARLHKVAKEVDDGDFGVVVNHVFKGSTADKIGIKVGDVLTKLVVEGRYTPVRIRLEDDYYNGEFPWKRYDEISEAYYARIPPPWKPVERGINKTLSAIGLNEKVVITTFRNGKKQDLKFVVQVSPQHYEISKSYASKSFGCTVRNITFELRKYFRLADDAPGVIMAKVEAGSKISIAGIKPYEIVTHVNGTEISDVTAFEKAITGKDTFNLTVKRMNKSRIVKVETKNTAK